MGLSALKNKAPVNCATTLPLEDGGWGGGGWGGVEFCVMD